ncbi:Card1-like endonuclease domain-containing protein [Aphanizomenon sp. CS-733/32]|uniref:Card1-like endonuclease domain-containing protein n=1 Tax=Aphanizomenon sp. CS-733/32 TaxID=3021715 RepID=UPI00232D8F76|nr:DUF1887 family CARF protein [Aphanizomenon sp. CS-733/32]
MSEKVFLALVGGRSATPTIMGALQFLEEFDRIKFLLCEHPTNIYQTFQEKTIEILKAQKKELIFEKEKDIRIVNGNDFESVYYTIRELCSRNINLKFVNVTSAPQEMAFAVYNYVRENYNEAVVFNVNTNKSQLTPLWGNCSNKLSKKLTVENYVSACAIEIFKRKFKIEELSFNEEQAEKIVNYLVNNVETSDRILSILRTELQKGTPPKTITVKEKDILKENIRREEFIDCIKFLSDNKIISKFNEITYSFRIEKQSDQAFLSGDWLEYFVYLEGKKMQFDSIELSVELNDFKGEVDVFCVHNANALICECKTGKFDTNDLTNLESKAIKLGGKYCVRLLITTSQKVTEELINKAKNRQILIVAGEQLKNIGTILKKQMNDPDFSRS